MAINAERLQVAVEGGSGAADLAGDLDGLKMSALGVREAIGGMGLALAAVAAGGIAAATRSAYEFEAAMADVQKVTSADVARELEGELMSLAETIPIPRRELVTLAEQAGKFGIEGSENISKFVETVGQIGAATDLAAEEAGTRFAKIAGAVGLPYGEIEKLGNATNALADSFKTDAGEISDSAVRASNVLSQRLGLGAEETLALSASMNEVSASSRLAAGDLKRAAEAMLDPKKVGDVSGALGMTTTEFKNLRSSDPYGLMQRIAAGMAEGGEKATDLQVALGTRAARAFSKLGSNAERTNKALETATGQFENGTSLAREMSIRTETAAGQWQLFKNKVQNAATTTGQNFLPILKNVLFALNSGIEVLGDINEKTDGWAGTIALVAGLIGGLVTAVGAFTSALATSTTAAAAASGAVGALGTAFTVLTGPIGIAIAAAVALYAAYKTNFLGLRDIVDGAISAVSGTIDRNVGPIMQKLGLIADIIGQKVGPAFTWLYNVAGPPLAALGQLVGARVDAIVGYFTWWIDTVLTVINAGLSLLLGDTDTALNLLDGLWQRTLDGILRWITSWPLVEQFAGVFVDAVSAVESVLNRIPGVTVDVASKARAALRNASIPQTYNREYQKAGQLTAQQLNQMKAQQRGTLQGQKQNVQSSGIAAAFGAEFGQASTLAGQEMNGMQTQTQSMLSGMETSTRSSSLPNAFGTMYQQAGAKVDAGTTRLQTAHDGAIGAMVQSTQTSGLPNATASTYQQSVNKQSTKLTELRNKHQRYLRMSKQDTSKSAMYKGFADMYGRAAQKQREKLNGIRGSHQQELSNISTDTNAWSLPTEMDSRYSLAKQNMTGEMGLIKQEHSTGLSSMSTETNNWSLPGDVNSKYGSAAGKQSTRLGEMYGEHNTQFGNMTASTARELGTILKYVATEFANLLRIVSREMGQAQSNFSGELGTMRSETSTKTGQMVGDFSSAFSTISRYANDIAREANMAASTARSALRSASSYRAAASRNAAGAASAARGGDDRIAGMASGGRVLRDGIVRLHKNEHVLAEEDINRTARPPIDTEQDSSGSGSGVGTYIKRVVVHANSEREGRRAGRGFVDELRADNFDSA
ncbi:phage tail tape measure protein [Halomarina oriensis]|uniref:Phage tail tape measure protein n=1 Tax=Halomarina oriensis TaxID=671145 RepID=A0A6B0GMC3_9EURY|nr:phage tail tape measure protein [Halomarina oriensis]MWG34817.1 phage tail tape measure protein [Halomarina oriensis]